MSTIFVIDSEESTRLILRDYLLREKFRVETFAAVKEVQNRLQSGFPDMFILDIMQPDEDILEFCRDIKKRSGLPMIVISDPDSQSIHLAGLELGSYNCLSKPFSPREVISRVRALFRYYALPVVGEEVIEIGNLKINLNDRLTTVDNHEVMLTPMEYEFLLLLVQQPQRSFNRQELLDRVWGCDYVGSERAVDDLVKRLRKKLRDVSATNNVKTIWGYGYRFED